MFKIKKKYLVMFSVLIVSALFVLQGCSQGAVGGRVGINKGDLGGDNEVDESIVCSCEPGTCGGTLEDTGERDENGNPIRVAHCGCCSDLNS